MFLENPAQNVKDCAMILKDLQGSLRILERIDFKSDKILIKYLRILKTLAKNVNILEDPRLMKDLW